MAVEGATPVAPKDEPLQIARRWCEKNGAGWSVLAESGQGNTATVFVVKSPEGELALQLYNTAFSQGDEGRIQQNRIDQQLQLKHHDCPSLVSVFDGGEFENRLFILMARAPGQELEKRLTFIPRKNIRLIVDQIARAVIYLRSKSLCHRDIKSANVFVSDDFECATLLGIR